jgi:Glycosyl transferase family 2
MSGGAQSPAVDIVVNNHDYGRYLGAAIDSALAQTYRDVRVIVVDDGSSDDSREVLRDYEGLVEAVLKENGGQASALNAGLARCRGEVVMFLDADDLLHPEAVERAVAALAADPSAVKVHMRMDVIDAAGRPTGAEKPPPRWPMPSGDLRAAELAYPFDLAWLPTSAYAFRRALLAPILPIPEAPYRIGADWHLVHVSTLLGPVAKVEQASCSYRVHGDNNYEPWRARLDLDHVRAMIGYGQQTSADLLTVAAELGLPHPARILSIGDLSRRMISLRLDPARHPVPGDTRLGLVRDSVGAVRRRGNASAAMRIAFPLWFAAMALAPRPLARRLALRFLFPDRRAD